MSNDQNLYSIVFFEPSNRVIEPVCVDSKGENTTESCFPPRFVLVCQSILPRLTASLV